MKDNTKRPAKPRMDLETKTKIMRREKRERKNERGRRGTDGPRCGD